ncbi:MAG: uracil-DNA glycosylase [Chloroflexi bacterium]|nr:uracil-DNA glycosylase [Chloroflexota bacterium]
MTPEEILKEVAEQTRVCTRCPLHLSRKNAVPGVGTPNTQIMFIGEGPGFHENEQGLPFVGAAGNFLDELLSDAGFTREEVFITNVVKCRPPGNRDPEPEELNACKIYLERQIAAINPDVIVTLGRVSMGYFIDKGKISSIHGRDFWSHGRMVVAMYHPAAALHQPSLRSVVKEDFKKLPFLIDKAQAARQATAESQATSAKPQGEDTEDFDKPEQLSLF